MANEIEKLTKEVCYPRDSAEKLRDWATGLH